MNNWDSVHDIPKFCIQKCCFGSSIYKVYLDISLKLYIKWATDIHTCTQEGVRNWAEWTHFVRTVAIFVTHRSYEQNQHVIKQADDKLGFQNHVKSTFIVLLKEMEAYYYRHQYYVIIMLDFSKIRPSNVFV